ncbi:hypothetical protein ACOSQ4_030587 [Xanthoceras sorbifolium]
MRKAQAKERKVFSRKGKVDETLIHELKFLKSVIKETLRLHPPGPLLLPRESRESCEIDGYEIPAKTRVIVNVWAMGRDPRYWTQAETFYPERFLNSSVDYKGMNFEYIPFGAGRRMCPGISFALSNIELPLAQLLYHFDWKLPNRMRPEDLDMTEVFGVSVIKWKNKTSLRNPKYWVEPESFNPERICPGISYGMANVELPLAMLLYHFDWELPNGMKSNDLNMTESFGVTIKRKDDLYAVPIPYHPSSAPQDLEKEA